ncbi:hypothetical protein B7494_g5304 [Chlorociboria aeruginascens]|nr:hypothetical protein B7494_g5304 [Chlorociboria aeruginascens]
MSNTQVGNVYQQIIADVIESSRVDFEEGGVDEHVLQELRLGWQHKLSQLHVATFPWDPKPEPVAPVSNPPTLPSNAGNYQPMGTPPMNQQPQIPLPQMPPQTSNNNGPHIKPEPGLDQNGMSQAPFHPGLTMPANTIAQQRAIHQLQNNFGQRAAASINAIQGGILPQQPPPQQQTPQQMQQHQMQHQQQMAQMHAQQRPPMPASQNLGRTITQEEYQRALAAQQQRQRQQVQHGVNGAQTDGADDEESIGVIRQFNSHGEEVTMGRIEIDHMLRQKIESMGQSMEGGGLMLPLRAATKTRSQGKSKGSEIPQTDGPGSDDDLKDGVKDVNLDEDAINSDLDDPDDGQNDEEDDDESMGHIMLCMKCVMKDGVLTVNGKEYVFHKASGEYEW